MNETLRQYYLDSLGIRSWVIRPSDQREPTSQELGGVASDEWSNLSEQVKSCTACGLHKGRTQTVFGVGNREADLLVIGEAPGFYEDKQGEPFVGKAGQLLDGMLRAISLDRKTVFIANVLKCRPPNNRDPEKEEVAMCTPFLQKQIRLIQPKLILALGRIAAHFLLNTDTPLGRMRGQFYTYGEIPLLVTYHPAYLLRNPSDKRKAWQDLKMVNAFLEKKND